MATQPESLTVRACPFAFLAVGLLLDSASGLADGHRGADNLVEEASGRVSWSIASSDAEAPEPPALFLTWQRDPATTMTIDWHVLPENDPDPMNPGLRFRQDAGDDWTTAGAATLPFPHSERVIHRVELKGLAPDTVYEFQVDGFTRIYQFQTMPARLEAPLVFAVGGDIRHSQEWMEKTAREVMKHNPRFIAWGGDLAYCNGLESAAGNWYQWFDAIRNTLITPEGRVVPIVAGIGNHETRDYFWFRWSGYSQTDEARAAYAPYFFALLAFPGQPGYGVLDFGDYLSLVVLDTDHANPIEGEQTAWLEHRLKERPEVPHLIPVYHLPAFPSVRSFATDPVYGRTMRAVRTHWVPLFEQHGVRVAFENHDHAYKRTRPIRADQVDPTGIVYVGDGAWGVETRTVRSLEDTWYLEKALGVRHGIVVTLDGKNQHFTVVSETGEVIDRFSNLWPNWLRVRSIGLEPGNVIRLEVDAPEGNCVVEASTDLIEWTAIAAPPNNGGILTFIDFDGGSSQRFYRLRHE